MAGAHVAIHKHDLQELIRFINKYGHHLSTCPCILNNNPNTRCLCGYFADRAKILSCEPSIPPDRGNA